MARSVCKEDRSFDGLRIFAMEDIVLTTGYDLVKRSYNIDIRHHQNNHQQKTKHATIKYINSIYNKPGK